MPDQKTIVLTGASRGIGHATVKRFSAEGWRVLTCSRHAFDPRCPWPGGEDNHIQIDLADPTKTIAALEVIKSKLHGK
ncbi:MAG: SDR family NAD(P)-dependent oxidoreductase, partial [Paracoccaceae bacterium]